MLKSFSKGLIGTVLTVGLIGTANAQSVSELQSSAKGKVGEIRTLNQEVNMLAMDAQQSNDATVIQCVSTKQASVSALADISESALSSITTATTVDKASFEMKKIDVSLSRIRQFYNEAQKCSAGASSSGEDGGSETQLIVTLSSTSDNLFSAEQEPSVSGSESYSFDSSNTSASTGADSINPPPQTSPY